MEGVKLVFFRCRRAMDSAENAVYYELYEQDGRIYLLCTCGDIVQEYQYPEGTQKDDVSRDANKFDYFFKLDLTKLKRIR